MWMKIKKLHLTTNMRVQLFSLVESVAYAQHLLDIGEGRLETNDEGIVLLTYTLCHIMNELIEQVFPNLQQKI